MLQFIHPSWGGERGHHSPGLLAIVKLFSHRDRRAFTLGAKRKEAERAGTRGQCDSGWVRVGLELLRKRQPPSFSRNLIQHPSVSRRVRRPGWIMTGDLESKEETEGLAESKEDPSERHQLATWLTTWLSLLQILNHVVVWGSLLHFWLKYIEWMINRYCHRMVNTQP